MEAIQTTDKAAFAYTSKTGEHYTPEYILQAAYPTLKEIDIDPAADPYKRVLAKTHYTKETDGLNQKWQGVVWLNPPYGHGVLKWFLKLKKEYLNKNVTEAIVVWKAATETKSWATLCEISPCICFPNHRVKFEGPPGKIINNTATYSSAIFYVGDHPKVFKKNFSKIGPVWDVPNELKGGEKNEH